MATLLDIPYKEPVLLGSRFKSAFLDTTKKFILAPKLIQKLDDEEFLFWTTYRCVNDIAMKEAWQENPNSQMWFMVKFSLCTQVVSMPVLAVKNISVLAAIATGVLLTPVSLYLMARSYFSIPQAVPHRAFEYAAQLTRLADAGERMFKKSLGLQQDLLSPKRRASQERHYELSVPPQYRKV